MGKSIEINLAETCPRCYGRGNIDGMLCENCNGEGISLTRAGDAILDLFIDNWDWFKGQLWRRHAEKHKAEGVDNAISAGQ